MVQHLDPKRRSMLPELLSRTTRISVVEAQNAMEIAPNHIYVMPSNVNIEITDGHFKLTARTKSRTRFLRSTPSCRHWRRFEGPRLLV